MKIFKLFFIVFLLLGIQGCSEENLDEDESAQISEDPNINNFIATLESWNIRPLNSVKWQHETDEDGLLSKSYMYEKFPERILWEIDYLEFSADNLPTSYDKTYYSYGEFTNKYRWEVSYNDNLSLAKLTAYIDGEYSYENIFNELDSDFRVKSISQITEDATLSEVYAYDEEGNVEIINGYIDTDPNSSDPYYRFENSYNSFQDYNSYKYKEFENDFSIERFFSYRDNNTLELTYSEGEHQGEQYHRHIDFDEDERMTYEEIIYGTTRWEATFYSDGGFKTNSYFVNDILQWQYTYFEDGSFSFRENEANGEYTIIYYDTEGRVYLVEHYDSDGNLVSSEEYSIQKKSIFESNTAKFYKEIKRLQMLY
ncbi:hypothetical protein ACW6QP_04355 [Salegentibacter sp. HM20]